MVRLSLDEIVVQKSFPEYTSWWHLGTHFTSFMSKAIYSSWFEVKGIQDKLSKVNSYLECYLRIVYKREPRFGLLNDFIKMHPSTKLQSGEFDAISYSFYRSAFEQLENTISDSMTLALERRRFTRKVGKRFFSAIYTHLKLDLPKVLNNSKDVYQLLTEIDRVGIFLKNEGYLCNHFAFETSVNIPYKGQIIEQTTFDFIESLLTGKPVYALYEMGYPIIMPSAVYLFLTMGEAQHHSSRMIEELFERVGCRASETPDFDPSGLHSNRVVELWEIQKLVK